MMQRRGFMAAMLVACAAPSIVRAGSLMRINPAIVGASALMPGDRFTIAGVSDTFSVITREVLKIAHSNLRFVENINREYEAPWKQGGRIVVRTPQAYRRKELA
jgi:hypothetical protein